MRRLYAFSRGRSSEILSQQFVLICREQRKTGEGIYFVEKESLLFSALAKGDNENVDRILKKEHNILLDKTHRRPWLLKPIVLSINKELRYMDQASALFIAVEKGEVRLVKRLLALGADINQRSINRTPLWIACRGIFVASNNNYKCNLKVVQALLEQNDVDIFLSKTPENISPLYVASEQGHADVVKALLLHRNKHYKREMYNYPRSDTGETPLYAAAKNGHIDVVRQLINKDLNPDVDLNEFKSLKGDIFDGATPIWVAACNAHEDVVEVLVEDAHVDLRLEPFAKEKYESLEYHISNFSKPAAHRILEFIKNRKNPEKSNKIFNPPSFPEWSEFWDRSKVAIVLAGKAYVETPSTDTNTKLEASNDKWKKHKDEFRRDKIEEVRGPNPTKIPLENRKHIENVKMKLRALKNVESGGGTKFCIVQ